MKQHVDAIVTQSAAGRKYSAIDVLAKCRDARVPDILAMTNAGSLHALCGPPPLPHACARAATGAEMRAVRAVSALWRGLQPSPCTCREELRAAGGQALETLRVCLAF